MSALRDNLTRGKLGEYPGVILPQAQQPNNADDFELITWLLIKE